MIKFTLIAAVLSVTGIAGYGQVTNINYVAHGTPGTAADTADQDQGGATLEAWSTTVQANGNYAGAIYQGPGALSYDSTGGWDEYAAPGAYSDQFHTFDGNLLAGQTLSISINTAQVATGAAVGLNLVSTANSYQDSFSLDFVGGDNFWHYVNGDAYAGGEGSGYQSSTPAAGTTTTAGYNYETTDVFSITMLDGVGDYSASFEGDTWTGTLPQGTDNIDAIRIFDNGGGANSDVVTNNLKVVPEPSTVALLLTSSMFGGYYLLRRGRR